MLFFSLPPWIPPPSSICPLGLPCGRPCRGAANRFADSALGLSASRQAMSQPYSTASRTSLWACQLRARPCRGIATSSAVRLSLQQGHLPHCRQPDFRFRCPASVVQARARACCSRRRPLQVPVGLCRSCPVLIASACRPQSVIASERERTRQSI
jgi:hypothetical protein